jgi:hypothetical protein
LLGTAMILAVPALAQTTPPGADVAKPGMAGTVADSTSAGQETKAGLAATMPAPTNQSASAMSMTAQTDAHARCAPAIRHASRATKQARAACRETASAAATGDSGWGLGAGATTSTAYTGEGGPYEPARAYPACSRTLRDSCRQRGGKIGTRDYGLGTRGSGLGPTP